MHMHAYTYVDSSNRICRWPPIYFERQIFFDTAQLINTINTSMVDLCCIKHFPLHLRVSRNFSKAPLLQILLNRYFHFSINTTSLVYIVFSEVLQRRLQRRDSKKGYLGSSNAGLFDLKCIERNSLQVKKEEIQVYI